MTACWFSLLWSCPARSLPSPPTGWPPTGCAVRPLGIAAIPIQARPRNIPRQALPNRSAAFSAPCCFAPASKSRCRRGTRPARLVVHMTDPIWDWLYAPLAGAVGAAADRLNGLQFLTIRQFLTLVFCALVLLLLVLAVWS